MITIFGMARIDVFENAAWGVYIVSIQFGFKSGSPELKKKAIFCCF